MHRTLQRCSIIFTKPVLELAYYLGWLSWSYHYEIRKATWSTNITYMFILAQKDIPYLLKFLLILCWIKVFNFRMLDPSWTNLPFKQKNWSGSSDPTITSDPLIAYGKGKKNENLNFFFGSGQNVFQLTWKEHQRHLMEIWRVLPLPNYHFWLETAIWDLQCNHGVCRLCPIFVQML